MKMHSQGNSRGKYYNIKLLLFVMTIAFTLMYAYTDLLYIGIGVVLLGIPLIVDLSFALPLILLFSFLEFDLQFIFSQYLSTIFMILVSIFLLFKLALKRELMFNAKDFITIFLIFSVVITTLLSNSLDSYEYKNIIIILITFLFLSKNKNINIRLLVENTILVSFFTACYFVFYNITNPWDLSQSRYLYSETTNVNTIAKLVSQALSVLLVMLMVNKGVLKRIVFLILISYLTYMLIALSSRSATLGLIIGGLIAFYFMFKNERGKRFRNVLLFSITLTLIYFILSMTNFSAEILERYSIEEVINSNGSNRVFIWENLLSKVIPDNFLFGIGFSPESMRTALIEYGSPEVSGYGHNILIDILAQGGFLFAVLLIIIFYSCIKGFSKQIYIKDTLIFTIPILTTLIIGIGETVYMDKVMWVFLIMLYIYRENSKHCVLRKLQ